MFSGLIIFESSPGYMLTKLTKTILSHDQELKVRPLATLFATTKTDLAHLSENLGVPHTHGQGAFSTFMLLASGADLVPRISDGRP